MRERPHLPAKAAAVVAGVEAAIEWLTPGPRPSRTVTVPDVVGLGTREAGLVAAKAGLRTTVRRRTERPAAVEGVVVAQDPAPAVVVRRRTTLVLDVEHPVR